MQPWIVILMLMTHTPIKRQWLLYGGKNLIDLTIHGLLKKGTLTAKL